MPARLVLVSQNKRGYKTTKQVLMYHTSHYSWVATFQTETKNGINRHFNHNRYIHVISTTYYPYLYKNVEKC